SRERRACRTYINQGLGLSPLPRGKRQRTIYSLDHARSGSNLHSASASPLSFRSRHSQPFWIMTWLLAIFMAFRGPMDLSNLHGSPHGPETLNGRPVLRRQEPPP